MKLLFSEHKPDYGNYIFPYAIWAVPERGESPADIFNAGFLPSSRNLDRFYLCRHVRVNLEKFKPSSENRRVLRKGESVAARQRGTALSALATGVSYVVILAAVIAIIG